MYIKPEDFLYLAQELPQEIELCVPVQVQPADPVLGFEAGISYQRRKIRGYAIEQKRTIATEGGIVRSTTDLVACVSSLDFKLPQLTAQTRIACRGEIFKVEHQKEIKNGDTSIYHELKLVSPEKGSASLLQPVDIHPAVERRGFPNLTI
ncbi:MAG: hypothetical protein HC786_20525 [Richelia sp. CSU_2_1]|nr:hypothetical protein [Richelia sp. CSU_2_1]